MLWFPSEPGDPPYLQVEAETWTAVDALVPAERRVTAVQPEDSPVDLWAPLWLAPDGEGPPRALLHYRGLLRVLDEAAAAPLSAWVARAIQRASSAGNPSV